MDHKGNAAFGGSFERIFTALLAVVSGILLVLLAVKGPLFLHEIRYKTAGIIDNQLAGQDLVNLFLLSVILVAGGVALLLRKRWAPHLLLMTPLYLIYYVLSYTIGMEWSSPEYQGNSQQYTFHFLFILVSALVILLYSLSVFPKNVKGEFKRTGLAVYSALFSLLLLVFASMWIREVLEVISTGTARGYELAPAAFWLVRIFDLGFTIPLGFLSVYLLWARPDTTYPVQFMFYGFFVTMIVAVDTMGFIMFLKHDPTFLMRDLIVFLALAFVVFFGFAYVIRHYRIKP